MTTVVEVKTHDKPATVRLVSHDEHGNATHTTKIQVEPNTVQQFTTHTHQRVIVSEIDLSDLA